jgi:FlaA1/EpsC-like NDP-sugar epimerase
VKTQLLLADIRNYARLKYIFAQYNPQYIYHAAAYKHVPLIEQQPSEAILTNVAGTKNLADLAVEYRSECFVMISTDKAVNPSSVMGASKRIVEIYIQYLVHHLSGTARKSSIRFIITRFGNVLGSNGSVIPLFEKQIKAGGPVTVTHPEIYRYFMTISEAVSLVLQAAALAKGGEIFVLDMGAPVKIVELAEEMIALSGLRPYEDIPIVFTGIRPGEKLFEELDVSERSAYKTGHARVFVNKIREARPDEVAAMLETCGKMAGGCAGEDVRETLMAMVKEEK